MRDAGRTGGPDGELPLEAVFRQPCLKEAAKRLRKLSWLLKQTWFWTDEDRARRLRKGVHDGRIAVETVWDEIAKLEKRNVTAGVVARKVMEKLLAERFRPGIHGAGTVSRALKDGADEIVDTAWEENPEGKDVRNMVRTRRGGRRFIGPRGYTEKGKREKLKRDDQVRWAREEEARRQPRSGRNDGPSFSSRQEFEAWERRVVAERVARQEAWR